MQHRSHMFSVVAASRLLRASIHGQRLNVWNEKACTISTCWSRDKVALLGLVNHGDPNALMHSSESRLFYFFFRVWSMAPFITYSTWAAPIDKPVFILSTTGVAPSFCTPVDLPGCHSW